MSEEEMSANIEHSPVDESAPVETLSANEESTQEEIAEEPTQEEIAEEPTAQDSAPIVSEGIAPEETSEENLPEETSEENLPEETPGNAAEETSAERTQESGEKKKGKKPSRRKRRKQKKQERIFAATEHDMKYRGPLSYRAFRLLAWVCMWLGVWGTIVVFCGKYSSAFAQQAAVWDVLQGIFMDLMMSLFLFASFATIINGTRKFSSMLVLYAGFSLFFYVLFLLVHDRYVIGIVVNVLGAENTGAGANVDNLLRGLFTGGYYAFNIFIDLFMCTLYSFFLLYTPKKIFVGKKLIWFRLFSLIPVLWEIASLTLKVLSSLGSIAMPTYLFPLLTTKPPMTFLVFVFLIQYIKTRERLYRKNGKSHEEYLAYLQTNHNSFQFSKALVKIILVTVAVDFVLFLGLSVAMNIHLVNQGQEEIEGFVNAMTIVNDWGIGGASPLFLVIPFILLFSYTRAHKDGRIEIIMPVVGVIGIALIILEGIYQATLLVPDLFDRLLGTLTGA